MSFDTGSVGAAVKRSLLFARGCCLNFFSCLTHLAVLITCGCLGLHGATHCAVAVKHHPPSSMEFFPHSRAGAWITCEGSQFLPGHWILFLVACRTTTFKITTAAGAASAAVCPGTAYTVSVNYGTTARETYITASAGSFATAQNKDW